MKKLISFLFFIIQIIVFNQIQLFSIDYKHTIPNDNDTIVFLKMEINPNQYYPKIGDSVDDFTVYTFDNKKFNLKKELAKGKPVLIITGSYSCPIYRYSVPIINDLQRRYSELLNIIVLYGCEAHPSDTDAEIFVNNDQGIIYNIPKTYGDKKIIVEDMLEKIEHQVPVFLDTPNSEVQKMLGLSPNSSFIIDTSGVIVSAHDMFHQGPKYNIYDDIMNYFNIKLDDE